MLGGGALVGGTMVPLVLALVLVGVLMTYFQLLLFFHPCVVSRVGPIYVTTAYGPLLLVFLTAVFMWMLTVVRRRWRLLSGRKTALFELILGMFVMKFWIGRLTPTSLRSCSSGRGCAAGCQQSRTCRCQLYPTDPKLKEKAEALTKLSKTNERVYFGPRRPTPPQLARLRAARSQRRQQRQQSRTCQATPDCWRPAPTGA